jgi:SLT domain-containing protein
MGADRYPEERQLALIRSWPESDHSGLMQYVESLWRGWKQPRNPYNHDIAARFYQVSTRGRPGNEAIITALEANRPFWERCWVSYRVGGHYEFKLKITAHGTSTAQPGEATRKR